MNKKRTPSKINLVQEFRKKYIEDKLPDFLYHYTSIEAFKSIIKNEEIYATVANYITNDPSEMTHAKKIALEILRERESDFNGKEKLYNNCKDAIENSDRSKKFHCICSFSEQEDLLSQWRAYCPKGGVSIGFSGERIENNIGDPCIQDGICVENYYNDYIREAYIYKCIYDPKEQKQKMNQLFGFLLEQKDVLLAGLFWKMIQSFSYSFKHKSFEEEEEWRLCYWPEKDNHNLKDRVKDSTLIPYWPFLTVDHNNKSIISKIMIGPARDKKKLKKHISSYLKDLGKQFSHIEIDVTKTPWQPQ